MGEHILQRNSIPRRLLSSVGVVVKLLACGAGDRGSIPSLAATISQISYLLLPVAIWLKDRLSDVNPQNNNPTNQLTKAVVLIAVFVRHCKENSNKTELSSNAFT